MGRGHWQAAVRISLGWPPRILQVVASRQKVDSPRKRLGTWATRAGRLLEWSWTAAAAALAEGAPWILSDMGLTGPCPALTARLGRKPTWVQLQADKLVLPPANR